MVKGRGKIFFVSAVFLVFFCFFMKTLFAEQGDVSKASLAEKEIAQKTWKLQMPFIANDGQTDERVRFYATTFGGTVFVTREGEIVYALPGRRSEEPESGSLELRRGINARGTDVLNTVFDVNSWKSGYLYSPFLMGFEYGLMPLREPQIRNPQYKTHGVALKEEFVRGKIDKVKGEGKAVTKVNYFQGRDPSKWKTDISTYEVVNLGEVYKGIELKLRAYGNNVEKLFCVKPDVCPKAIKVKLSGAKALRVNEEGQLEAQTELGPVKFTKPIAYQIINGKRMDVECKYTIADCGMQNAECKTNLKSEIRNPKLEYGFKVASYDTTKELIIDPLLASTYLGGTYNTGGFYSYGDTTIKSITLDAEGNVYVAGYTNTAAFPTTSGAYDTSYGNKWYEDAFISKLNGDLTTLLASTYLGGEDIEKLWSIAIDSEGNVYVAGWTGSSDFPTTTGAYDTSHNGDDGVADGFISKLSGDLTKLLASTYLGGSTTSTDKLYSMILDTKGNVYVTGIVGNNSYGVEEDFPTTPDAYDTSFNGGEDVFISKLSEDLTKLLASTYLGGTRTEAYNEGGRFIALESEGNVYVTGWTISSDFPTTSDAYDTSFNGGSDVFISKLNGDLTKLLVSTYLGGPSAAINRNQDCPYSIVVDLKGNVYVAGSTYSSDFPTTPDAYDTTPSSYDDDSDAFISKLSGDLSTLLASTLLGGSGSSVGGWEYGSGKPSEGVWSIATALDAEGNIYITGDTFSKDFPTTSGAYDTSYNGGWSDAFVSKLNGDLTTLLTSTYLGGHGNYLDEDCSYCIAIDPKGNVYVAGDTYSSNFPTTEGAYDTSFDGVSPSSNVRMKAFISKFDSDLSEGTVVPTPHTQTSPVPTQTPNQGDKGSVFGYVIDVYGNPLDLVRLKLRKKKKVVATAITDGNGFFVFSDLDAGKYMVNARKKGYMRSRTLVMIEEGEKREVEITMITPDMNW